MLNSILLKCISPLLILLLFFYSKDGLGQEDSTKKKIIFYDESGNQLSKEKQLEDPNKNFVKLDPFLIFSHGEIGLLYERKTGKKSGLEIGLGTTIVIAQAKWNGDFHGGIKTGFGYFGKLQFKYYFKNLNGFFGEGFYLAPGVRYRHFNFTRGEIPQPGDITALDASLYAGFAYRTQWNVFNDTYIGVGFKYFSSQYINDDGFSTETINISGYAPIVTFGHKFGLAF